MSVNLIGFSQLFSLVFTGEVFIVSFTQEECTSLDFKSGIPLSLGSDSSMKFIKNFSLAVSPLSHSNHLQLNSSCCRCYSIYSENVHPAAVLKFYFFFAKLFEYRKKSVFKGMQMFSSCKMT